MPATVVLPRIQPIIPVLQPATCSNPSWLFEPKYDGFRGIVYLTRKSCMIYSKGGNAMTRFRELADQLRAELPRREVILDGEIIATDDEGRINFWDLMRRRGTLAYAAFDILGSMAATSGTFPLPSGRSVLSDSFRLQWGR